MNLNCETILGFYTFKRKKILCQIKVNRKSQKSKNTCRCLSQEQWARFDKKLEKLLTASNKLDKDGCKFNLDSLIEVKVQKSKLSFEYFYQLLDTVGEFNKSEDTDDVSEKGLVLECLIDFQQELPSNSPIGTEEYEPEVGVSPNVTICSPLPYKPYTPSKKNLEEPIKGNDTNYLVSNEDTYSPKPLLDEGESGPHFAALVPEYTPAPINERKEYKDNAKLNILSETSNKPNSRIKQHKSVVCEYIPKSQDVTTHKAPIYIPTPIEEITQKICSGDNFKKLRKRSNTIDVWSEPRDDKDTPIRKTKQNMCDINSKFSSQKSLKKRSMTIDEMPADISDVPVYIPSSLDGNAFQSVPPSSSKYMKINHDIFFDRGDPAILASDAICNVAKMTKSTALKSMKNKSFLTRAEEEPLHDNRYVPTTTKDVQLSNDVVFETVMEKTLPLEKKLSNSQLKSEFVAKIVPEAQRQENVMKLEVYNSIEKNTPDKRLFDYLPTKDADAKVPLKRCSKIENHDNQTYVKCRRSERSPHKPKRLIEEQFLFLNKTDSKEHKTSLKNKELFGSDDDDDDSPCKNIDNKMFATLKQTSESKGSSISSSSKKKKHKKHKK